MRRGVAWAAILVLVMPVAPAQARVHSFPLCGGGSIEIPLPGDKAPAREDDGKCCKQGCHSGNERRKRLGEANPDSDCC